MQKIEIENYTINPDGSIDVDRTVYLTGKNLDKIPLKFNRVEGNFYCSINNLYSLKGSPNYVGGNFCCSTNNLRTLKYGPKEVKGDYGCFDNNLVSLEGFPDYLGGSFYCMGNPVYQLWKLFETNEDVELFNDYDIVRDEYTDQPKIVLQRLNAFLDQVGQDRVEKVPGYINIQVMKYLKDFKIFENRQSDELNAFLEQIGKEPLKSGEFIKGYTLV